MVRQRPERGAEMVSTPPLDSDELAVIIWMISGLKPIFALSTFNKMIWEEIFDAIDISVNRLRDRSFRLHCPMSNGPRQSMHSLLAVGLTGFHE